MNVNVGINSVESAKCAKPAALVGFSIVKTGLTDMWSKRDKFLCSK